jgi:hypothetical protein
LIQGGAASIDTAGILPFFLRDLFDTIASWVGVSLGFGTTIDIPLSRGPITGMIALLVEVSLESRTAIVLPLLARGPISDIPVFGSTRIARGPISDLEVFGLTQIDVNPVGQMALSGWLIHLGGVDPLGSTPLRVTPAVVMPSPVELLGLRGTVSDCSVSWLTCCGATLDGRITPPTRLTPPVPALGALSLLEAITHFWSEAIWACVTRNSFSAFCFFLPMVKPRGIEQ